MSDGTTTSAAQPINFAANGGTPTPASLTFNGVAVNLSGITSYAGASTAAAVSQDGSPMGSLQAFTMSPDGTLVGVFSNGLKEPLAQIAMAAFNNPGGLEKAGDSQFRATVNSGAPQLGVAGNGGRGLLQSAALEMSNVDLAQEFTNLVIAQRGFQANSKVVSTSDELLQDLVNLKR
jgi:flagellar hook protein FlgE